MSLYKRSRSNSGIHADYTPNLGVMADLRYYDQLADNEYAKLRAFRAYLDEIEDNMLSDGIICEFYEKQNRLKAIILSKCFDFEIQDNSIERKIVADYGYEFGFHVEVKSHPFREAYLERRGKQMIVQIVPKGIMLSFTPKAELLKETVSGEYLYYSWEGQTSQISYGLSIKRPWCRKDECNNKIYLDSSDGVIT